MIRLGIVDFDTSHAVEFTKRLNHLDVPEDQWVDGAKVVAGVPGTSRVSPASIPKNLEALKKYGIEIVDRPDDLFGKVDAVLVVSVDGGVHLERAMPFLERGVPTYVDKPFACSLADALKMVRAAEAKHVPLMSCSSLRYAPEVVAARRGKVVGVSTYGPAPTHPRNPGLFHYGIHATEILYTLMGRGCTRLTCLSAEGAEVTTGVWADGRVASVRGVRDGRYDYGFTLFGDKGVTTSEVGSKFIYREMLKQVVTMFETRMPPIDLRETLEIVAFIEAAKASADAGGAAVEIKV